MKDNFRKGDIRKHYYTVTDADVARFGSGVVHQVCSTFVLAREMEWAGRLFVLDMKEAGEEGIGTMVHIEHVAPALPGDTLFFEARSLSLEGNNLLCEIEVTTGGRLIAKGSTGQKIVNKQKIDRLIEKLKQDKI